jgi:hypothetical protein
LLYKYWGGGGRSEILSWPEIMGKSPVNRLYLNHCSWWGERQTTRALGDLVWHSTTSHAVLLHPAVAIKWARWMFSKCNATGNIITCTSYESHCQDYLNATLYSSMQSFRLHCVHWSSTCMFPERKALLITLPENGHNYRGVRLYRDTVATSSEQLQWCLVELLTNICSKIIFIIHFKKNIAWSQQEDSMGCLWTHSSQTKRPLIWSHSCHIWS